jgi:chromosome segregation ATPase
LSRGITEHDVDQAADALLLQGLRPTIERIRLQIGRGSPNTVSPHLESWFRRLGQRLQAPAPVGPQPRAAEVPDPVDTAARQLWQAALASARQDVATLADQLRMDAAAVVDQARAEADAAVTAARVEVDNAQAQARSAAQERDFMARQLDQAQELVATLRQDLAARSARLEDAGAAIAALGTRLQRQETRETESLADLRQQLAAALARADTADRRVALELDRERTLRAKAERRIEQAEAQLERDRRSTAERLDESSTQARLQLQAQADAAQQREVRLLGQLDAAADAHAELCRKIDEQRGAVEKSATALAVVEAEAAMLRSTFERLAPRRRPVVRP